MAARLAVSPCPPRATRLVLKHGACPDCHENFLQNFPGMASGSFQGTDHDYPSELDVGLTATDSSGLANTASARLLPAPQR
jgi:hypothetical protein